MFEKIEESFFPIIYFAADDPYYVYLYAFIRSKKRVAIKSAFCESRGLTVIVSIFYSELPHCINQWTSDHVQSFFTSIGLQHTLLNLCTRMDGYRLLQLFEMCMSNRESMYQSLKAELSAAHHGLLSIGDYLTFLHEIKKYVPHTPAKTTIQQPDTASSMICNVM